MKITVVASLLYITSLLFLVQIELLPLQLLWFLVSVNLLVMLFYGLDKLAACKGWQRTPELRFYSLALLGAWPGSVFAQYLFRHKTSKQSFRIRFYLASLIHCLLLLGYLIFWQKV